MSIVKDPVLGLFDSHVDGVELAIEDGQLHYFPSAFSQIQSDELMEKSLTDIPWKQERIHIAGKLIPIPRLQCWLGDSDAHYSYSKINMSPEPWPDFLCEIKSRIELLSAHSYNSVLANYYRDGSDSVDWHSDDEDELGSEAVIASLSLGTSRVFELKHRYKKQLRSMKISLPHGSVLIMKGCTQQFWRHRIAKVKDLHEPRINFTFRHIFKRAIAQ